MSRGVGYGICQRNPVLFVTHLQDQNAFVKGDPTAWARRIAAQSNTSNFLLKQCTITECSQIFISPFFLFVYVFNHLDLDLNRMKTSDFTYGVRSLDKISKKSYWMTDKRQDYKCIQTHTSGIERRLTRRSRICDTDTHLGSASLSGTVATRRRRFGRPAERATRDAIHMTYDTRSAALISTDPLRNCFLIQIFYRLCRHNAVAENLTA